MGRIRGKSAYIVLQFLILCGMAGVVNGQHFSLGDNRVAWPVVGSAPQISQIRSDSMFVDWPLYDQFNPSTHYQVRVNSMLYGNSVQQPGVMVQHLLPGATYQIAVVTFHDGVVIGVSSPAAVLMAPATPTDVHAVAIGSASFTLQWTEVPTATSYRVYREKAELLTEIAGPAWSGRVVGLTPGSLVAVELVAVNASGESYRSAPLLVQLLPPPPVMTVAVEEIGQTEFTVRWTPAEGAASYAILLDGTVQGGVASSVFAFQVSGLTPGASYTCQLRAENQSGMSELSTPSVVLMRPATPLPPVPSGLATSGVTLAWPSAHGADGYKVYVDQQWIIKNVPASFTTVALYGYFNPGEAAAFSIVAYNKTGDSEHSPSLPLVFPLASEVASLTAPSLPLQMTFSQVGDNYLQPPVPGTNIGEFPVYTVSHPRASLAQILCGQAAVIILLPRGFSLEATGVELAELAGFSRHLRLIVLLEDSSIPAQDLRSLWIIGHYNRKEWQQNGMQFAEPTVVLVDRFASLRCYSAWQWATPVAEFVRRGFPEYFSVDPENVHRHRRRFNALPQSPVTAD